MSARDAPASSRKAFSSRVCSLVVLGKLIFRQVQLSPPSLKQLIASTPEAELKVPIKKPRQFYFTVQQEVFVKSRLLFTKIQLTPAEDLHGQVPGREDVHAGKPYEHT